jgi:hypothetical protein
MFTVAAEGCQVTPLRPFQEICFGDRSRGVGADDFTTDEALGGGGIFDLLSHRDPEAGVEELTDIASECVVWDPAHGSFNVFVVASLGQDDSENRRSGLGILEEQLVKITHSIQQESGARLLLEVQVLPKHGGYLHQGIISQQANLSTMIVSE